MKYLRSFLAVIFLACSTFASAVPVIKINANDTSAPSFTAHRLSVIVGNPEPSRVIDGTSGLRKAAYFSSDRVATKANVGSHTPTASTENIPIAAPDTNIARANVSYDQIASSQSPMTDPVTWLLLVFGIGFVAFQSGRRSSTVSAVKLQ